MRIRAAVLGVFLLVPCATAQSNADGLAICEMIGRNIRMLVKFTNTECFPAAGKNGGLDIILVATEPVFAQEVTRKGWLMVAVAATAMATEQSRARTERLLLSDSSLVVDRKGYAIDTAVARRIRGRMKAELLTLDEAVQEINNALTKFTVQR